MSDRRDPPCPMSRGHQRKKLRTARKRSNSRYNSLLGVVESKDIQNVSEHSSRNEESYQVFNAFLYYKGNSCGFVRWFHEKTPSKSGC